MHAVSLRVLVTVRHVIKKRAKSSSFLGVQAGEQITTKALYSSWPICELQDNRNGGVEHQCSLLQEPTSWFLSEWRSSRMSPLTCTAVLAIDAESICVFLKTHFFFTFEKEQIKILAPCKGKLKGQLRGFFPHLNMF